jgi:hypothetical protein
MHDGAGVERDLELEDLPLLIGGNQGRILLASQATVHWHARVPESNSVEGYSQAWRDLDVALRSPMKQVFAVMLVVNPLPCCHSSENGAASRSTLPKGIDEARDLLIVCAGLLVRPTLCTVGGTERPTGCGLARLKVSLVLL